MAIDRPGTFAAPVSVAFEKEFGFIPTTNASPMVVAVERRLVRIQMEAARKEVEATNKALNDFKSQCDTDNKEVLLKLLPKAKDLDERLNSAKEKTNRLMVLAQKYDLEPAVTREGVGAADAAPLR